MSTAVNSNNDTALEFRLRSLPIDKINALQDALIPLEAWVASQPLSAGHVVVNGGL